MPIVPYADESGQIQGYYDPANPDLGMFQVGPGGQLGTVEGQTGQFTPAPASVQAQSPVAQASTPAPAQPDNSLEGVLGRYNQSNFDVGGAANAARALGKHYGLTDADLAAAATIFGDQHRAQFNSGYTEGSNYNAIAQRAVEDALRAKNLDASIVAKENPNFVNEGARAAQERWQATQEKDDGGLFGDLGIIAQLAALIPGPQQPFLLAANAANNLSKGNIVGAALNAFGAYSTYTSAVDQAISTAGTGYNPSFVDGEAAGAGTSMFGNGASASAASNAKTVLADAGSTTGVTNDAGPQTGNYNDVLGADTGYLPEYANSGAAIPAASDIQAAAPVVEMGRTYSQPGIIDKLLAPISSSSVLTIAGGIGSALLNRSAMASRIQADKELLSQKTAEDLKKEQDKRALIQGGSYFDSTGLPKAPAQSRVLRRPDGSLVFAQPGIIAGAMQRRPA